MSPCPFTHVNPTSQQAKTVENDESSVKYDPTQVDTGSTGPPSGGLVGSAQHFDIASNGEAPLDDDSELPQTMMRTCRVLLDWRIR